MSSANSESASVIIDSCLSGTHLTSFNAMISALSGGYESSDSESDVSEEEIWVEKQTFDEAGPV